VHPLDTERIFRVLGVHSVRYTLVGGIAAILHQWSGSTADVDIVPAVDTDNLNRLGRALQELSAVVWADPTRTDLLQGRKPPEADEFGYTAEGLRSETVWHLTSDAGLLDIAYRVEAIGDYDQIKREAENREVFGLHVLLASLDQIIASKRAVARAKDLRVLPELEELRDLERRRKR
jgi:hypothetical protein